MLDSGEFGGPQGAFAGGPLGGLLGNFSGLPEDDDPVYDFSLTPRIGNVQNRVGTLISHPDLSMIDYGMDENTTVPRDAFELFANKDLQHLLAAHHLTSLVDGYRGLPRDTQTRLRSDARHALGVQSVGKPLMDAYESILSGGQTEDYAANERAAEALSINPDISTQALIGQVALGTDSPIGLESAETPSTRNVNPYAQGFPLTNEQVQNLDNQVYDLDNAYAQLDLDPFYNYINPAIEAIKNSALAEAAKKIDAVPIPGLEVIQGLDIGKKVLDSIPDIMGVDFPSYGPNIPGKGGGVFSEPDGFEPSMNLQMELNPAIDSNLFGVEGLMEAGGFQGGGSGVIGPDFDARAISEAGGEALQEALAQRAVENILSQQAPREMINVTPPAPPKVAPQRRAAPKPSPIQVAAKAITRPKAMKALPKPVQESLRQGKVPTGLNSRNQDLVDRVLATPKVDMMSASVNVKGNKALQKARARAAQDAK
jgi:hypothetical protein